MTFTHKYFSGRVPEAGERQKEDQEQLQRRLEAVTRTGSDLEACHFKAAMREVMGLARAGNVYFDQTKPFLTRKTDLAACGRAINVSLQTARTLTTRMAPFLPATAATCARMLQMDNEFTAWSSAINELPADHALGPVEMLVKKLDGAELFNG